MRRLHKLYDYGWSIIVVFIILIAVGMSMCQMQYRERYLGKVIEIDGKRLTITNVNFEEHVVYLSDLTHVDMYYADKLLQEQSQK